MPLGEDRLLKHNPSDESLFDDLKHVVSAPQPLLSHLVGSRTEEDREELGRILTHLPVIRKVRGDRAKRKAEIAKANGEEPPKIPTPLVITPLAATPREATPPAANPMAQTGGFGTPRVAAPPFVVPPRASTAPVGATPRGTPRGSNLGTPRGPAAYPSGTPRGATPRVGALGTPRQTGAAVVASSAAAPAIPTPAALPRPATAPKTIAPVAVPESAPVTAPLTARKEAQAALPPPSAVENAAPAAEKATAPPSSAAERAAATHQKALLLRGDKTPRKPDDEKKHAAEATQRVIEKLAELGIDPEGMSATDILRIFYARGSGSSYWHANREAEKRLNVRASTPRSFAGVLQPQAEKEIRRARDLPVTNVHEYLDQWEIAFLGDVCRSLRCFDEAAEGNSSEYMTKYTRRQYGMKTGRKPFVRRPAS